jgi:predicted RNase H-like HicB family nuclease
MMNDRFNTLITREDQFYVARCPELAITSQGITPECANANLREAINLYLETWGDPSNAAN